MTVDRQPMSGPGNQEIQINVWYSSYNQAGNYATFGWEAYYFGNGWGSWGATLSWGFGVDPNVSYFIPQSEAYKMETRLGGGYFNVQADANGYVPLQNYPLIVNSDHSSIGNGRANAQNNGAPRIPKPPLAPGAPTFSNITDDNIRVSSSFPDSRGAAIDAWDFQYSTSSNMSGAVTKNHNGNVLDITMPSPNTLYYFRTRAHNAAGWGDWSAVRSATTLGAPAKVPNINVTIRFVGALSVAWSAPETNGYPITKYELRMKDNVTGITSIVYSGTSTQRTVTDLVPGRSYTFDVRAFNASGAGPYSSTTTSTTLTGIPTAPTGLSVSGIEPKSATLSWNAPSSYDGSSLSRYELQRALNPSFTSGAVIINAGSAAPKYEDDALSPAVTYHWRVRAVSPQGPGPWSNVVSAKTKSGAYVGTSGTYQGAEVKVGSGGSYVDAEVLVGKDGSYVAVG